MSDPEHCRYLEYSTISLLLEDPLVSYHALYGFLQGALDEREGYELNFREDEELITNK